MKILFVLTSHGELGNTGKQTGFWIEEFAAPYYVFKDAGVGITVASPKGGQPPIDPKSDDPDAHTKDTIRFKNDPEVQQLLAHTKKLSEVRADEYDGVFFPGGHGPLWDLAADPHAKALIEAFLAAHKPVGAVCHAPAVLLHARGATGEPLVKGKRVTGFTNSEEEAVGLKEVVPFLLEDELKAKGGIYSKKENWASYVLTDGLLVTGQNPASSEEAAHRLLELMQKK